MNVWSWEALVAISTMIGSFVSAVVLGLTVYQLKQQNKRQNELDERQKKIEEREKYQIELNIKQSLFERRLLSWQITKVLYLSVETKRMFGEDDNMENPIFLYFDLTNNFYLEGIQNALGMRDIHNREWRTNPSIQNNFLKKLSEMELLSDEITLLFSGEEMIQLSQFINGYKNMLASLRKHQMVLDQIQIKSEKMMKDFEVIAEGYDIQKKREILQKEYDNLCDVYRGIKENKYLDMLYMQIKFAE